MEYLYGGVNYVRAAWIGATAKPVPVSDTPANDGSVTVYRNTTNPTKAWQELKVKQTVDKVTPLPLDTPIYPDKLRFVCLSDTHNQTERLEFKVPMGDVLLHAGDFTRVGSMGEVLKFNGFLGEQHHTHKVVIAGNHDLTFDKDMLNNDPAALARFGIDAAKVKTFLKERGDTSAEDLIKDNCIYLCDSGVTICGIRIYGSPWQPEFGGWGFNLTRGQECLDKWDLIPAGVEVLMTHGPPIGHGDACFGGHRAGCVELLSTIQQRVKPKYHIFGHIHEAYGITTDGFTTFINASTCTLRYKAKNPAIIFDIPIPPGHSKDDPFRVLTAEADSEMKTSNVSTPETESVGYKRGLDEDHNAGTNVDSAGS